MKASARMFGLAKSTQIDKLAEPLSVPQGLYPAPAPPPPMQFTHQKTTKETRYETG